MTTAAMVTGMSADTVFTLFPLPAIDTLLARDHLAQGTVRVTEIAALGAEPG